MTDHFTPADEDLELDLTPEEPGPSPAITADELRGHAEAVRRQGDSIGFRIVTSSALDRAAALADEMDRHRALVADLTAMGARAVWPRILNEAETIAATAIREVLTRHGFGDGAR